MKEQSLSQASVNHVKNVIEGGYCIGCGACAVKSKAYSIEVTENGFYQARQLGNGNQDDIESICPFSSNIDENEIGRSLFEKDSHFDNRVGFYQQIYAGYVTEKAYRSLGSSGGLVTWILSELLTSGEIDCVIHVGETGRTGELFEYRISETLDEVKANAKSRYYPVHIDEVIQKVRHGEKKYAFIGVPCFIKAMRLLMKSDPGISARIKFCIAIFCGHFKTKAFAEMIAWQQNVAPQELVGIDFRVKNQGRPASQYSAQIIKQVHKGKKIKLPPVLTRDLYGMDWGLGYFKPKACEWCDDIAGETADLACGDAWLPEYSQDASGTNVLVVRNKEIHEYIQNGIVDNKLHLKVQSVDKVYESQAGNYRHRQEGLAVRVGEAKFAGVWHPRKRIDETTFAVTEERKKIYLLRAKISEMSHRHFIEAKQRSSFILFVFKMMPLEIKYYWLNKNVKNVGKMVYQLLKYLLRKVLN